MRARTIVLTTTRAPAKHPCCWVYCERLFLCWCHAVGAEGAICVLITDNTESKLTGIIDQEHTFQYLDEEVRE